MLRWVLFGMWVRGFVKKVLSGSGVPYSHPRQGSGLLRLACCVLCVTEAAVVH